MFAKLLKHEFRATRSAMRFLFLSALILAVAGGLAGGMLMGGKGEVNDFLSVLGVIVLMFSCLFIAVCAAAALVAVVVRFYQSRFTDEGYLTFTLPVSTHQVLLSSLVSSVLNMLLSLVVTAAAYGIMGLILMSFTPDFWSTVVREWPAIWSKFVESWNRYMDMEMVANLLLALGGILVGGVSTVLTLMLSVTLGALAAKKHKILVGVGFYYGLNTLVGILSLKLLGMTDVIVDSAYLSIRHMMNSGILLSALVAVAGYFAMYYLVNRKLNLP